MKRIFTLLLCVVLLLSVAGLGATAAEKENIFPLLNPSAMIIAAAVDNEIDRIYDNAGAKSEMYFAFSPEDYVSLEDFGAALRREVWPLMNALYATDMVGQDYITMRSAYGVRTLDGKAMQYYYIVTLKVNGKELRAQMDRIIKNVKGQTDREKIVWLKDYLYANVEYDEDTMSTSGTQLALMEGKGVCMGYARAMLELCRRLDIPCFGVVNDEHMWNSVQIEEGWQMLDATWNIPPLTGIYDDKHGYDASLYQKCIHYFDNFTYYKGKAAAALMEDLTANWYRAAVEYTLGNEIFKGVSSTSFAPNQEMTRGMFVTVLGRLAGAQGGVSGFVDVSAKQYYAPYVGWAKESGIVNGISATRFAPEDPITREQLCKMMAAFAKYQGVPLGETTQKVFADDARISNWAKREVYKCAAAGLVQGKGKNVFDPMGSATRAEVAVILCNFNKFTENSESK